jgi:ABC-type glycerol-3-phosphate transport system permease component
LVERPFRALIPLKSTLKNYSYLFTTDFPVYIFNSLIVAIGASLGSAFLAAIAAYSITRLRYRGKKWLAGLLLFSYLFPGVLLLVPIYIFMSRLKMLDTLISVTIVHITFTGPFCVWLLRSFFEVIPVDIEEAALVDGCTRIKSIFKIVLPLAAPGIAVAAIYTFIMSWSDYIFATVLLFSDAKKTVPIGLARWVAQQFTDWGVLNAGAVLSVLPVLIIFALVGKYFVAGLVAGAVKQ